MLLHPIGVMKTNRALLRLINLPVFSNLYQLAQIIHIKPGILRKYNGESENTYTSFYIDKSDGSKRLIQAPVRELKGLQAWVLRNILDKLAISPYATAYIEDRSILDNVTPHRNNRYFICIDLEDFFPSITRRRIAKLFSRLGYSQKASEILAGICTYEGKLPQGAVTSPALSNIIASKLDRRIAGYTSKRNIIYTRYSDDITLSSNNRNALNQSLSRVIKIIKTEHFRVNNDKLRILGPRRRISVTGLVKNNTEAKFSIGRRKKRHMRAVIHHHYSGKTKDSVYSSEPSIMGWMAYLKNVDLESFGKMHQYLLKLKSAS
jgi:RNA-directed DNA polymerase